MSKFADLALCSACIAMAFLGCHGQDQTVTTPIAPDPSGMAGTNGDALVDGGSVGVGAGGAGGSGGELDDPFGIGPRYCDLNRGAGGDSCVNFTQTSGFYTEPENLETNVSPEPTLRVWVATEFTPTTALKQALEEGLELHELGSDVALPFSASWVTQNLESSGAVLRAPVAVAYDLVPAQALREGWYSLIVPYSARAALGALNRSRPLLPLGGHFGLLQSGDLRADFRVGSLPFLSRVKLEGETASIVFSEQVEAAVPPVTLSVAIGSATCAPEGWTGAGRTLVLTCSRSLTDYGQPVHISFGEGLKSADGTPLRGPDGATSFELELMAPSELNFDIPTLFGDAGAP